MAEPHVAHGRFGVIVHRIVYATLTTMAIFEMVHATVFGPTGMGVTGIGVTGIGVIGIGVTGIGVTGMGVTGMGVTGMGVTGTRKYQKHVSEEKH